MSVVPSAPPDASGTVRGFVNLVAQTFAGAKTFTSAIVASAGIQVASLFNANGTGASDVGVVVGVSTADGSVNAGAKLVSWGTGVGGTYAEKAFLQKSSMVFLTSASFALKIEHPTNPVGIGSWQIEGTPGSLLRFGNAGVTYLGLRYSDGFAFSEYGFELKGGSTVYFKSAAGIGRLDQWGTDDSATAGNRTVNKPTGTNKLANGATTCVITNSLCSATSRVMVTFHDDPGARYWVTRAAGSFTVNLSAAAGADKVFSWEVANIL